MMTMNVASGSWWQAAAVIMVNLLTAAFTYGAVVQKQKEHERRLNAHDEDFKSVDNEQGRQWQSIGHVKEGLAALTGKPPNGD